MPRSTKVNESKLVNHFRGAVKVLATRQVVLVLAIPDPLHHR
jgi:hypothetical protein